MRERLLHHLRQLPQIVQDWNRPADGDLQPSQFARSLTKVIYVIDHLLDCIILFHTLFLCSLWLMNYYFPAIDFHLIRLFNLFTGSELPSTHFISNLTRG